MLTGSAPFNFDVAHSATEVTNEELGQLIGQREGPTLEFKENVPSPDIIARLMSSFANAEGGRILFGIREPRQVVGIDEERLRKAVKIAERHITGEVNLKLDFTDLDGHRVGVLTIEPSKGIVAAGGGYYRRFNDSTRPMTAEQIREQLIPAKTPDTALLELSHAVAQQTQIIEDLREEFRKANATWKKILLALGGAVIGAFLRHVIDFLLSKMGIAG